MQQGSSFLLNKYFFNKTVLIRQGSIAHINIGFSNFLFLFGLPFDKILFYNSIHFFPTHIFKFVISYVFNIMCWIGSDISFLFLVISKLCF